MKSSPVMICRIETEENKKTLETFNKHRETLEVVIDIEALISFFFLLICLELS